MSYIIYMYNLNTRVVINMEISKRDWKLFKRKIGGWQEAYMERLLKEYVEMLNGEEATSTKFWNLDKRIKEDRRKPGVLIQLRKSEMLYKIIELIDDGVITEDDLEEFSDDLKERVNYCLYKRSLYEEEE